MSISYYVGWSVILVALVGAAYTMATAFAAARVFRKRAEFELLSWPAITVLKPLYGAEHGLKESLASLLHQDYPGVVQIVFGVRDSKDPALAIARDLALEFPSCDIAIVVDSQLHGANNKISNLINMTKVAKHDTLVMADSDILVRPGYLRTIARALARPNVGAVSCLYSGNGHRNLWSRLQAMGINYHFLPNVAFSITAGIVRPCFGSTIALRRSTLDEIGGFGAFVDCLAEDYEMGRAVREKGYGMDYPPLLVTHICSEDSMETFLEREVRWARTTRTVAAAGHFGSVITHPFALGLIGATILGFSKAALMALPVLFLVRLFQKWWIDDIVGESAGAYWLIPLRDVLSFGVFIASLFGSVVQWKGTRFRVGTGGIVTQFSD